MTPAKRWQISAEIGYRVGMTTAVVELTQDRIPEVAAIIGVAVCSVMKEASVSEIRSMPPSTWSPQPLTYQ